MKAQTQYGSGKPRNRATVAILIALAYYILPALPRFAWLPVIAVARSINNYGYHFERGLRMALYVPRSLATLPFGWTNFPGGVMSYGAPAGDFGVFSPFGVAYFVDIGHANANADNTGKNPARPMLTLLQAINLSTASQGDVVMLAAGHAEASAAATGILTNKAGVTTIGMGRGADRATFTLTNAAGNIPISGASSRLINVLVTVSGTTDVTAGVTVSGADAELIDVELRDGAATAQFAIGVSITTGAARAKMIRYIFRGSATGDANTAAISCAVALDGVEVVDANIDGLLSLGGVYNVTTAMTNLTIMRGNFRNRHATQDASINVVATTTGFIVSPRIRSATNDADGYNLTVVAAAMQWYDIQVVNADGEKGGFLGTASAAA